MVANSVYGFTGARKGYLPCPQIASSVTAFGRKMIEETQNLVETKYTKVNGYDHDAVVVYGDTDSVMVKFGYTDLAKVMELGKEAAEYITGHFKKPINLEFEKAFSPFLLLGKKQYAGLHWTNTDAYDKMDIKGIAIVRRDRCVLIQEIMQKCLDEILINREVGEQGRAVSIVHRAIEDLRQGRTDLKKLTLTGGGVKIRTRSIHPTLRLQ